jgi:hypothetical protein
MGLLELLELLLLFYCPPGLFEVARVDVTKDALTHLTSPLVLGIANSGVRSRH